MVATVSSTIRELIVIRLWTFNVNIMMLFLIIKEWKKLYVTQNSFLRNQCEFLVDNDTLLNL